MAVGAVPNNSQPSSNLLISTARALFVGLVWGAMMLIVFGSWINSKYDGGRPTLTYIFFLAGLAAAGLAIWQAFALWIKKDTPEQKALLLEQQRRLFSYAFIAGGLGLIVMAFVLGVGKKTGGNYGFILENFAETFGVLLFGLIALGSGYVLQQPQNDKTSPIQFLVDKVPLLKLILVVIGVASLGTFVYLYFAKHAAFMTWWPEYAGLVFMSMLCFGCMLWLNTGAFDEFGIRLFVLVFGGTAGLIVFLMLLCQAYLWRQDIILGGSAAWQGENAWHFWLCAYALFASLVVMFISFNLARADIRKHAALRVVMYGYDTLVQALLLIGILAILNVVIYALVPFSFDWTKNRGAYAISDASKNLIAGLKQETNVIVLLPQNSPVYKDVRNLLDNCQAIGPADRFKVKYYSPNLNQREYADLANNFPAIITDGKGILLVSGPLPTDENHKTPHAFIPERRLFEEQRPQQRGEKMKYVFKGEGEILKELKFLVDKQKKRKIYILQGNDEPDIADMGGIERLDFRRGFAGVGLGFLVERLTMDNYDVAGLSFGIELPGPKSDKLVFAKETGSAKKKNIPEDCDTLIVAGASRELKAEILDAIERYMDGGGRMLVFLDVVVDDTFSKLQNSGMEALVKRYGVEVTSDLPLRLLNGPRDDPRALFATAPAKSENLLARQFPDKTVLIKRSARVVRPVEAPGRYKAETVLQLQLTRNQIIILENDVRVLKDYVGFVVGVMNDEAALKAKFKREPVPVAVAVTSSDDSKPRMVVFGDTEFITNLEIARSPTKDTNYAFTVGALEWMAERASIGALPQEHTNFSLDVGVDYWRMVVLPGWLMLLTIIGLGVAIWIIRRR